MATFQELVDAHVSRGKRWHPGPKGLNSWSLSDWGVALTGEIGEAMNIIKKLNRLRDGLTGNKGKSEAELVAWLGEELADALSYTILLAEAAGIDLEQAHAKKFNEVSELEGFPERLRDGDRLTVSQLAAKTGDRATQQKDEFDALTDLCKGYRNFCSVPIVDDDYPEARHYYESRLNNFIKALKVNRGEHL